MLNSLIKLNLNQFLTEQSNRTALNLKNQSAILFMTKVGFGLNLVQFSKMLQKCFYLSIPAYGQASEDDSGHEQKTKKAMGNKIF